MVKGEADGGLERSVSVVMDRRGRTEPVVSALVPLALVQA